jgi:ABC-2 type transport system ATP-binding protein
MDEAEFCDRIAIIDRGVIVALGSPDELKAMVGGDVVTVATTDLDRAAEEISRNFGLTPTRDDGVLRLEVEDGAAFVPRLVRELTVPVSAVTQRRPSLDDVFLKLTGRAIRDEEADVTKDSLRMMARLTGRRR